VGCRLSGVAARVGGVDGVDRSVAAGAGGCGVCAVTFFLQLAKQTQSAVIAIPVKILDFMNVPKGT
jgi:hypothetical protein